MRRPERELRLERERAEEIVTAVLNAGYSVGVNDGEETTIKRSTNKTDIFKALWTTDEDVIIAYDKATGKAIGTIYLVYGNGAEPMRDARGQNVMIGHYFPDMVRTACDQAREWINRYPEMRKSA